MKNRKDFDVAVDMLLGRLAEHGVHHDRVSVVVEGWTLVATVRGVTTLPAIKSVGGWGVKLAGAQ
jgi:hypothetical protein